MDDSRALVFGPIPSRRLGRSLGINNIPPKVCSYSCVYCQLGPTSLQESVPRDFHEPERLFLAVERRLSRLRLAGLGVDHLSFVPDGEPTLDARLGETIGRLRALGLPIAVITNGSLLYREEVRERLAGADWVSVKVDAVEEAVWRRINRPAGGLTHDRVLGGVRSFVRDFAGTLVTETMLVKGLNDGEAAARAVAGFLAEIAPAKAYLSVPIRPPAERDVRPPDDASLVRFHQLVSRAVAEVELLTGYEGDEVLSAGAAAEEILAIAAVHPLRESAIRRLLASAGENWSLVEELIRSGLLVKTRYQGHDFFFARAKPASGQGGTAPER